MAKASATKDKDMAKEKASREAGSKNQTPPSDSAVSRHQETAQAESHSRESEPQKQVSAQRIEFAEAASESTPVSSVEDKNEGKLDIILDMNVPVTVAIGQAEIPVRRLLQLQPGSVLKLDKPVDAPVDLFLKDSRFAEGDVVVVDNRFAVRIKQIIGAGKSAE